MVDIRDTDGVVSIRRLDRHRTVRIDVNLRGRDLVSWVAEARAVVAKEVPMPPDYRVAYGGQFENFERAKARLAIVLPICVGIIFGMLLAMFKNLRLALAVFVTVPFSLTGGLAGLLARSYSFSLPAAVGFIALGGIAVLNGVVMASEVNRRVTEGAPVDTAILDGSRHVVRAVLTTTAVAALGFVPMAIATSAGAEVRRPLATVVIVGILYGAVVTLFVLPGVLRVLLRKSRAGRRDEARVDRVLRMSAASSHPRRSSARSRLNADVVDQMFHGCLLRGGVAPSKFESTAATERAAAALISARCANACGKFPRASPLDPVSSA